MKVAGKAPPDRTELKTVHDHGFDFVEIYLEKDHLRDIDNIIQTVNDSPLTPVSVHIPHVLPSKTHWIERADEVASTLNALLAIHSMYFDLTFVPEIEELDLSAGYGYENIPGSSVFHLTKMILEAGYDLVLDTAHLYMAEKEYFDRFEQLLSTYQSQIKLIHLCDSTYREDGLAFGEGTMNLKRTIQLIKSEAIAPVVLEVMPDSQAHALEKFHEW